MSGFLVVHQNDFEQRLEYKGHPAQMGLQFPGGFVGQLDVAEEFLVHIHVNGNHIHIVVPKPQVQVLEFSGVSVLRIQHFHLFWVVDDFSTAYIFVE
jgi:hypothetical protein